MLVIFLLTITLTLFLILSASKDNSNPEREETTPQEPEKEQTMLPEPEKEQTMLPEPETIDEYYASIDYSCQADSDCEVKDVHNCCGYFPACANINSNTNPDFVRSACEKEGLGSVCGFPAINNGCKCEDNTCKPN